MIKYPTAAFMPNLRNEMRHATRNLPPYEGGPGVDYSKAPMAYALTVSLLHDSHIGFGPDGYSPPCSDAEIALVQHESKAPGQGRTWGGVTGYIDKLYDPTLSERSPDDPFDPIAYAVKEELEEECSLYGNALQDIWFAAGEVFEETRTHITGAKIRIVPFVGMCSSKPLIAVDGVELLDLKWVRLDKVRKHPDLSPGYLEYSLPGALGALGMDSRQIADALRL